MEVNESTAVGATTFGRPETVELATSGDSRRRFSVTCAHGEWRPSERLLGFLPDGFFIPLDCYWGPDGMRRIVPRCIFEELIDMGAAGGLAVLHGIHGFRKDTDHSYRAMLLIHQYVRGRAYRGTRGMKEHLTREFQHSRDLYVRRSGRLTDGERDVLPDHLGLSPQGEGHRLSVTELTEHGRQVAQEAGYLNPTSRHAISFSLHEAAIRNPLELDAEEVPALVQLALFDLEPSEGAPSPELIDTVTERLLEAIHRHLADPREQFDRWFSGPNNSLVKQLAQQQGKPGGRLPRDDVRRALLVLGWQAYEYVAQCIDALMGTIKDSIPEPLNDQEKRLFEHMYESQPYYGNLPAALLAERMPSLSRSVQEIWNEPQNPVHVRVLHRLLQYYVEMVHPRREADRRSKRQSHVRAPGARHGAGVADSTAEAVDATELLSNDDRLAGEPRSGGPTRLIENLHSSVSSDVDPFKIIGDHLRELHQIECPAGCLYWEYRRKGNGKQSVVIQMRCECGKVERTIRMSMNEFAKQAQEVLG